jgi:DNA-binding Lrp family transcriptional regulator
MSLTGHLDVFPLEEVLRLLARSYKSGCLRVDSPDLHGRVYLTNGSLALVTVGSDEDLRRQLIGSKLVGEDALRSAEIGGKSLNDVASDNGGHQLLDDFFREEVVESLYRIRKPGRGQFVFNVDVAPRYRADTAFDVELCVSEADRRAAEWSDIESVIPSIDLALRISPEAPNGEPVTLAPNTWRLVAGFEGSGTVRSLSDRLGLSRFRAAKDLTALVRSGLVEAATAAVEPEPVAAVRQAEPVVSNASTGFGWRESVEVVPAPAMSEPEPPTYEPPQPTYAPADYGQASYARPESAESIYNPFTSPEPEVEPVLEQIYTQPEEISPEEMSPEEIRHEETRESAQPDSYNQGWWTEPAEAGDAPEGDPTAELPVDSDKPADPADTFLDRVFSQLDETPEGQGSSHGTTHGFLKRRRMSSIGADE